MAKVSSKGNTVTFPIDVWYDQQSKGTIKVASKDPDAALSDFNVSVTNCGHPQLFRRLRKLLLAKGAPAPS